MESKKLINFDLNTKNLKKYYPKEDWRGAYKDIKDYMLKNNFEWQQGSCYISKTPISKPFCDIIISKLLEKHSYLNLCFNNCIISNIGKMYDVNYLFDRNIKLEEKKQLKKTKSKGMSI